MRKLFLYVYFTGICIYSYTQYLPERAALNPSFVQYMESFVTDEGKKSSGNFGLGYFPNYLTFHFGEAGLIESSLKKSVSLPVKFDLRDINGSSYVTSVKDQGPLGACWTFSTVGAIESNWLKRGYGYFDLSEQNMATCHGFEWGIDDGGNDLIALAYLTRLAGPVTEESDPYNSSDPQASCKKNGLVIPAFIPTAEFLPKNSEVIKEFLMKHGAISASMYTGGNNFRDYYNPIDYTFYYEGTTPVDHAVLLVGWDDSKVITGGLKSPAEKQPGAWIVKNSWGQNFGNEGYFYISYEDSRFLHSAAVFRERIDLYDVDTIYYNDYLGATTAFGFSSELAYGLVRYNAPAEHFIRKVGTFINAENSVIDIEIYQNFQADSLLTDLVASSYGNRVRFPGYQTFDISANVSGDFYVKVQYRTPDYNFPIPAEVPISFQGRDFALPDIKPSGNHWVSSRGVNWLSIGNDVPGFDADLCIRVYADAQVELNPYFTSDKSFNCVGSPMVFNSESKGNIVDYHWTFGAGATPSEASDEGPHSVNFDSPGWKEVKMRIIDEAGDTTFLTRNFYIEENVNLDVYFLEQEVKIGRGRSATLTVYGADSYTWEPLTGLNIGTGPEVTASPQRTTTYTVTGIMGTCSGTASIRVRVVSLPPNDDVCDAIELKPIGRHGPFSNVNATVQPGEPSPPEGDCNAPLQWCVEGGLHNSVWFWFYGTNSGMASFDTEGFDTQIAIYKADHCDSIFSPTGHVLIAANDDYHGEDKLYAAAIDAVSLIPGQKYFLQVDGSAGGDEGFFYITFYDSPITGDNSFPLEKKFNVYPNPATGTINVSLEPAFFENAEIRVFNLYGQLVYHRQYDYSDSRFFEVINLAELLPGFYLLEFSTENEQYRKQLIIR